MIFAGTPDHAFWFIAPPPKRVLCSQPFPVILQAKPAEESMFSSSSIKASVSNVIQEASKCDASEYKKRIRALQLRWHPDKHPDVPALRDLATEVTKIINDAVQQIDKK